MESLHEKGILMIADLQEMYKSHDQLMLKITQLGDPAFAFIYYFPICFFINGNIGVKVLWIAALTEWINGVLKWFLYGHRPYWYPAISKNSSLPILNQYELTCETGPGSPSGHAMVTSAVLFFVTNSFLRRCMKFSHAGPIFGLFTWFVFTVVVSAVGVSRCFIATHFPHQVVAGILSGLFVALYISRLNVRRYSSIHYIAVSLPLLAVVFLLSYGLYYFGIDTNWSYQLAIKYCKKKEWIHYNTTVLSAFIRDSASLLGLGYGLEKLKNWSFKPCFTIKYKLFGIVASILFVRFIERIEIPSTNVGWFYVFSFMKYYTFVYVIVTYLNLGVSKSIDLIFGRQSSEESEPENHEKTE